MDDRKAAACPVEEVLAAVAAAYLGTIERMA